MGIRAALSVFCCLLQGSQAQVDISGCCTHVKIETTGEARTHQGNRIGEYRLTGVLADRPIYKNVEREEFLFYLQSNKKGLWMVGPTAGQFNGGLAHRGDTYCVEDVRANQWKYTDGSAWHVDSHLRVSCLDETVTPQCLYNDQTEFIGGDLPEVFGGGGVETSMESSADCIEECEKRSGCKYWTWVMGEKVNCFLKNSKVETARKPKYVSGSIPQACTSTPSTPTQAPSTYTDCTYKSLDFQGGDLFTVLALDVNDCRKQCEEHVSCQLFTYDRNLERGCYFKTDQVTVSNNEEVISGATAEICEDFILPHVTQKNEEPVYNENEVNAKFKITSLRWDEKLNDPNSQEYQDLSNTIEDSIESMLRSERDLDEQAEFSVEVQKFRKGSVVCDFKVNYILKEAYVAIPFAIKPSNISDAMSKNFKFKKGILFQRFLIAAGSFNSSAPVDHCAAKGCSHKCDYDYDIEDYLCTCPKSLVLDSAGKTCIDPEEAATEETVSDTTDDTTNDDSIEEATTEVPEVKLTLLPSDCLWSPWSDWTSCSSSCGEGKMERQRSVVLPEKNGGACPGRFKEVVDCSTDCEDKNENETTESNILARNDDNSETTTTNVKESEETATEAQTEEQTETGSTLDDESEDNIEETVTKSEISDGEKEDSGTTDLDEQTTVANKIEEVITILPNENVKSNTEESLEDEETAETVTAQADESSTKDDIESSEDTTEFVENFQEVTTDVSNQNDNNNEQTTMFSDDGELDDAFGRKITTDATEQTEEIDGITIQVTDLETTTESKGDTSDEEKESEEMKDIDSDEDTRIVFPLNEDVEIILTTKSPEEDFTTKSTKETETKTESPFTSADMVNEEATEFTTTTLDETEGQFAEEGDEAILENEFETTTKMQETTSSENKNISKINEEKDIDNELENSESESTTNIPYEADTETAIDYQDNVENRSQSESTTMKDFENDKEHEYETTTHIGEDFAENKIKDETPSTKTIDGSTEVTTTKSDDSTDSLVSQTTISPDVLEDSDEAAQTISKEPVTDESGSDATTEADTTGEDEITTVQTITAEATEKNLDTQTTLDEDGNDMEKTTTEYSAPDDDAPTKAPRFDIENEMEDGNTTDAPKVGETTNAEKFTTSMPIVDGTESTTAAIISIEETDDEVTIVTTAKPYIQEDDEGDENTVEQETTTAYDIIEQATESLIEGENPKDPETSDTDMSTTTQREEEEETTTTPSDEYSDHDHEFLCKESVISDNDSDVPLDCVLTNGEDERTVVLVIPADSLGGDRNKLFNKNVKIVVKDFMIMERGPRTLS